MTISEEAFTDAYAPPEVAKRVRNVGVAKATQDAFSTFVLAVLAGAFLGGTLLVASVYWLAYLRKAT